jgi:hypothetical protein
MLEWLTTVSPEPYEPLTVLAGRLCMAWLGGWVVAWLARRKQSLREPDTLSLTLVLMSILIAMATQIIGDNIARAFSLVGALSIVRFRTAVPATRDVAFVLAAVVVGMAMGAGQYLVAVLGLMTVGLATQLTGISSPSCEPAMPDDCSANSWRLTLQSGLAAGGACTEELQRLTENFQLLSVETTRRGSSLEMVYRIVPRAEFDPVQIVSQLNAIQGIELVLVKQ